MAVQLNLLTVITDVAQAITNAGINVYVVRNGGGDLPAAIFNTPSRISFATTYGATCSIDLTLTVFVDSADLASAHSALYALCSYDTDEALYDRLLSHSPTAYKRLEVLSVDNFSNGDDYISADFNLRIHA